MDDTTLYFSPLIIFLSFIVSLGLTAWVRKLLLRRKLLDMPNERSSHTVPVPRGGGWAVLLTLMLGLGVTVLVHGDALRHAPLFVSLVLLALISWLDDRHGVKARARLSFHIFAAALSSTMFPPDMLLLGGLAPLWLDRMVMIIGWAWFMNLYNFMDGIDGITGTQTISIAAGICFVMALTGIHAPFLSNMLDLLIGASLGFLVFNWHPAKIFLGDVGSVPLGYLAGFALISLALYGYPVPAFIIPLYYSADSGITLARRALRGEKIWQAHREHFYQKAALALGRHDKVVFRIAAANIALVIAALVATGYPLAGLALGLLVTTVILHVFSKT